MRGVSVAAANLTPTVNRLISQKAFIMSFALSLQNAPFQDSVQIGTDADGRFRLNDLHLAAGGEQRHRPHYWLENEQTKALIEELRKSLILPDSGFPESPEINHLDPISIVRGGLGEQGTYVVRELVYAYAMWVSPALMLRVIKTFDAVVQAQAQAQIQQLQLEVEIRQDNLEYLDKLLEDAGKPIGYLDAHDLYDRHVTEWDQQRKLTRKRFITILKISRVKVKVAKSFDIFGKPLKTSMYHEQEAIAALNAWRGPDEEAPWLATE